MKAAEEHGDKSPFLVSAHNKKPNSQPRKLPSSKTVSSAQFDGFHSICPSKQIASCTARRDPAPVVRVAVVVGIKYSRNSLQHKPHTSNGYGSRLRSDYPRGDRRSDLQSQTSGNETMRRHMDIYGI